MYVFIWSFPGGSNGKASAYNAGDPGLIPGLGRSPGEVNGIPLQYYIFFSIIFNYKILNIVRCAIQ